MMQSKIKAYNQKAEDKEMPNLDDFYAFKSTSSGGGNSGGVGCFGSGRTWFLSIAAILWIIGKLFS